MAYDLDDIRKRELGKASPFEPVAIGGQEFAILPPSLWGDAAYEVAQSGDVVAAAKAMLGDEQYEAYRKAGGTAGLLMLYIGEAQGATPPESSASTDS